MPTKVWQPGEEVLSSDFNPLVQEQVVPLFATVTERDAAMPAPKVGQHCYVADLDMLLQYTDRSVVPGWHRPWSEPWGTVAAYVVTDQDFGAEGWIIGGGYTFPTARRLIQVRYTCWAVKAIDGGDAHCVLRLVGGPQVSPYTVLRDSVTTLHQGWAAYFEVTEMVPSDTYPIIGFRAWSGYGTWRSAWSRVSLIDMGPTPISPQP